MARGVCTSVGPSSVEKLPVIFYNRIDRKANTLTLYMKTFTLTSKFTFSSAYRGYTPASPSGAMVPGARTPRLFGERPGTWVEGAGRLGAVPPLSLGWARPGVAAGAPHWHP